ncbi:hypothetical protein BCR33DRAFT_739059 [Rhizoclosmatium globosum]|uniref:Uncharacterized protein n=1 Tax=Rhizoclosmatium globosum TaxID=329046 RepID=A0A1Y2C607_9FUNG|nr:hypothetical protein BCR33DRAFT_739059 [Rhizoclosmatium globosum]|eukprot:ORY42478.1 hypothetical protein BCR33DRAFT_739059 [Rhizoclosmatium globosum]
MQNLAALLVKKFDNELDRYWAWITATTYPDLVVNKSYSIHDLHQAQQGATAVKAAKWNAIEDAKESRKRVRKAKDAEIAKKEATVAQLSKIQHPLAQLQQIRPAHKAIFEACITDYGLHYRPCQCPHCQNAQNHPPLLYLIPPDFIRNEAGLLASGTPFDCWTRIEGRTSGTEHVKLKIRVFGVGRNCRLLARIADSLPYHFKTNTTS